MRIFKPKDYNFYVNATNTGRTVAMKDVYEGFIGKIEYNHTDSNGVTHDEAFLPLASADLTSKNVHVALFEKTEDTVEYNRKGFRVDNYKSEGEHVRVYDLSKHDGLLFEITSNLVKDVYASINVGDELVPTTDGSMILEVGSGSSISFEVIQKDIYFNIHYLQEGAVVPDGALLVKLVVA